MRTVKQKEPRKKAVTTLPTIVAIGASVGGLNAVSTLFRNLPANTGMAFIYVQHLSPDRKSATAELLSRVTKMTVREVTNNVSIKPNCVYVIPHNKVIVVRGGHIKLLPRSKKSADDAIDVLFSSLAKAHGKNVIGIVLSGNASDGTAGLKAIKNAGGLTFAQNHSAKASGMPKSAIAMGVVDLVLSPAGISRELLRYSKNGFTGAVLPRPDNDVQSDNHSDLKSIYELLHKKTGVDFSYYKSASTLRRLNRKMHQRGLGSLKEYAKLLHKDNKEAEMLYKDILINVTGFFRDTEIFNYLKSTLFPKLLRDIAKEEALRIWVPACATGEEVYSIAMLIAELQTGKTKKCRVQIFATDLSEDVIHIARRGEYEKSDLAAVSPARIKRFFTKKGDSYEVIRELREMCVFAQHNLLTHPPFFRIDFISCRNLLIYFDTVAQKKALSILSYGLKEGKYLMLGKSESTAGVANLFAQVSSKYKVYCRKKNNGIPKIPELLPGLRGVTYEKKSGIKAVKEAAVYHAKKRIHDAALDLDHTIDSVLLSAHMPACIIINKDMEILQFRGKTSLYLAHPSGKASLNVLKMVRPEFSFELRNAVPQALKTDKTVYKSGIEANLDGVQRIVSIEVHPLAIEWDEPLLLVIFTFKELAESNAETGRTKKSNGRRDEKIKKLTEELNNARKEMQQAIDLQERAYEELQAANEEVVSTNEEFQALNEELETSKEEIEATNEELVSSNQELQKQNELLADSYNYSQTIIDTMHEPLIVLDSHLRIKSANRAFYKKFGINKADAEGALLFKLNNGWWKIPELVELLKSVFVLNANFEDYEIKHVFPDIGERILLFNVNRIVQKSGDEKLILLAIEDTTDRHYRDFIEKELLKKDISNHELGKIELEKEVSLTNAQLRQKNKELESLNQDLRSFSYVSSHDLQEPLRKIQNFTSILLEEETSRLSPDGKIYLKKTSDTAKRMQLLIDDLLVFAATRETKREFEKIDFKEVLAEVEKEFKDEFSEKKAVISFKGVFNITGIKFQFHQLVHNLVGNSLKFLSPERKLNIKISNELISGSSLKVLFKSSRKMRFSSHTKYWHFCFADNGIGFEPKFNDRIFELFQRLHGKEEYKGTGIGLAICKRIVENHKGIITANGKLNKGATFDIYIPVTQE